MNKFCFELIALTLMKKSRDALISKLYGRQICLDIYFKNVPFFRIGATFIFVSHIAATPSPVIRTPAASNPLSTHAGSFDNILSWVILWNLYLYMWSSISHIIFLYLSIISIILLVNIKLTY